MPASVILKIIMVIPLFIAGGIAISILSYLLVPMMIAGGVFSLLYILAIDLSKPGRGA